MATSNVLSWYSNKIRRHPPYFMEWQSSYKNANCARQLWNIEQAHWYLMISDPSIFNRHVITSDTIDYFGFESFTSGVIFYSYKAKGFQS